MRTCTGIIRQWYDGQAAGTPRWPGAFHSDGDAVDLGEQVLSEDLVGGAF
ncbi:hypothetical protein [Corynebacterium variabile]